MSKPNPSRHAPEEVDAYLEPLSDDVRAALESIRSIIHEIVPDCTERVSYKIPIFRIGKDLVGMAAHKNHCSLYAMSSAILQDMKDELKDFNISNTTLHFTPEKPLSRDVVEKIVRARLAELDIN